jgi:hypothetical protein
MRLVIVGSLVAAAAVAGPLDPQTECVFSAQPEGAPPTRAIRCAEAVSALAAEWKKSPWAERCGDAPDLERVVLGEPGGIALHRFREKALLVRVRCSSGAYNETWLHFVLEPQATTLRLLWFPGEDGVLTPLLFSRDFDEKRGELLEYRKELGDGSAGAFRRFTFDGLVPVLREAISKEGADGKDGWHFQRGSKPRGPSWKRSTTEARGCVGTLSGC